MGMAQQYMDYTYRNMAAGINGTLGNFYMSMQTKYGDPRVYQAQQEQMRLDEAAVKYARHKKTERLLEDAYKRQQQRNAHVHNTRLTHRGGQTSSARPESQVDSSQSRTPVPRSAVPAPDAPA